MNPTKTSSGKKFCNRIKVRNLQDADQILPVFSQSDGNLGVMHLKSTKSPSDSEILSLWRDEQALSRAKDQISRQSQIKNISDETFTVDYDTFGTGSSKTNY